MGSMPTAGILIFFILLPMAIWVPYGIYVIFRRKHSAKLQIQKLIIWFACVAIIISVHLIRHIVTRHDANSVVSKIRDFSLSNRRCPSSLDEVGITKPDLQNMFFIAGYWCKDDGKPKFIYGATFVPYSLYSYDFIANQWNFEGD